MIGGSALQGVVLNGQTSDFHGDHIERVVFDNGTVWTASDIVIAANGGYGDVVTLAGTGDSEFINGTAGNDVIDSGAGDDVIDSRYGSDLILWGTGHGNDTLQDVGGAYWRDADTLRLVDLNASDVELSRQQRTLTITVLATGETFVVTDKFNFSLGLPGRGPLRARAHRVRRRHHLELRAHRRGGDLPPEPRTTISCSGRRIIEFFAGFGGSDYLQGSGGNDTYVWSVGDGDDTIAEFNSSDVDTLRLHGVDYADIQLVWNNGDLDVRIGDETIHVSSQQFGIGYGVEQIVLDDGTVLTNADFTALAAIYGTDDDDFLFGRFAGRPVHRWTRRRLPHRLIEGSDTYVYAFGDGNDEIDDGQPFRWTTTRTSCS